MRRGSAVKNYPKRASWLVAHAAQTIGVPSLSEDVTDANRAALERLDAAMVAAGLFSGPGTRTKAARRETIRRMVGELRAGAEAQVIW